MLLGANAPSLSSPPAVRILETIYTQRVRRATMGQCLYPRPYNKYPCPYYINATSLSCLVSVVDIPRETEDHETITARRERGTGGVAITCGVIYR